MYKYRVGISYGPVDTLEVKEKELVSSVVKYERNRAICEAYAWKLPDRISRLTERFQVSHGQSEKFSIRLA